MHQYKNLYKAVNVFFRSRLKTQWHTSIGAATLDCTHRSYCCTWELDGHINRSCYLLTLTYKANERFFQQEIRSMERISAQCCIPYTVIEIFDCNCNGLELGRFKVIQGQRSWCQTKAHGRFPIWPSLSPTSYLTVFEIFDIKHIFHRSNGAN